MSQDDHIKARAHQIWEQEGKPDGAHEEHWRRAQEELDIHGTSGEVGGMLGSQASTEPSGNAPVVSPDGGLTSVGVDAESTAAAAKGKAKASGTS